MNLLVALFFIEDIYTKDIIAIYKQTDHYCFGEVISSKNKKTVGNTFIISNVELQSKYGDRFDLFKDGSNIEFKF